MFNDFSVILTLTRPEPQTCTLPSFLGQHIGCNPLPVLRTRQAVNEEIIDPMCRHIVCSHQRTRGHQHFRLATTCSSTSKGALMQTVFALVFWTCLVGVVYAYTRFRILVFFLVRCFGRRMDPAPLRDENQPSVSLLVAVYNEGHVIEERLSPVWIAETRCKLLGTRCLNTC